MERSRKKIAVVILSLCICSCAPAAYLVYSPRDSSFTPAPPSFTPPSETITGTLPAIPDTWEVVGAAFSDVTGDGAPEWVMIVSRPWRDWPIITWHGGKSPIADFRDGAGNSSHLIVMTRAGREIWAGSALPRKMTAVAAGDIDGDGVVEVVTLEGDYRDGPNRRARFIDVWAWNVFGFALESRSAEGTFRELYLRDENDDGILDVIVR